MEKQTLSGEVWVALKDTLLRYDVDGFLHTPPHGGALAFDL